MSTELEVREERPSTTEDARRAASTRWARLVRWRGRGAVVVLICLVAGGLIGVDHFGTKSNLVAIVESDAFVGMAAIGMTWVVLSGNFVDLSVPSVIAVASNTVIRLGNTSLPLAIITLVAIALVIGVSNGWLVGGLGLNPVIATLGTGGIVAGVLFLATGGRTSVGNSNVLAHFASAQPLGIPVPAIVFVVLVVLNQIVLGRTRFGATVHFYGNNPLAGRASGVRSLSLVVMCFSLSALIAAISGMLLGAYSGFATVGTGAGYDFQALAAVVVGGTLLAGGIGSFGRTFAGVLVIAAATNIALLLGLSQPAQLLVTGIIFIVVVAFDAASSREAA